MWVGNFDGSPMRGVSGVSGAAPILHDLFEHLHARFGTSAFARPATVVEQHVHPWTGHRVPAAKEGGVREWVPAAAPAPGESTADYDDVGRAILPGEYREWFAAGRNPLAGQVVVGEARAAERPGDLRVLSPLAGTVFFLDPDLPGLGGRLRLRANDPGELTWSSPTLGLEVTAGESFARLLPGRHELVVRDPRRRLEARTWIEVRRL